MLRSTPPAKFPIIKSTPAVPVTASTQLHHLARGERVDLPFTLLRIGHSFLENEPSEWASSADFQKLKEFVHHFKTVNDCAEHAVQLATDFNEQITKNPEQRKYLYAQVTQQRRDRSDLRRKALQPKWFFHMFFTLFFYKDNFIRTMRLRFGEKLRTI